MFCREPASTDCFAAAKSQQVTEHQSLKLLALRGRKQEAAAGS